MQLTSVDTHFEFGANWQSYLEKVDEAAIREAECGLLRLIPADRLKGSHFLDIGCGSGLHSLAALRLGASAVVALDIDPRSVQATREMLARFAPGAKAEVKELSVFDASDIAQCDVVYSWGVLHHTGDMWRAIEQAARLVRPGGLFAIALYQRTPLCGAWTIEKRLYTASPNFIRASIRSVYIAALIVRTLITGKNPLALIRNYKSSRGMNFFTDVHDWLGGYPYESATPEEILAFFSRMGFKPVVKKPLPRGVGLFGTGCAEFTFEREMSG